MESIPVWWLHCVAHGLTRWLTCWLCKEYNVTVFNYIATCELVAIRIEAWVLSYLSLPWFPRDWSHLKCGYLPPQLVLLWWRLVK